MTDTLPADYERLAPWLNVIRQMNSVIVLFFMVDSPARRKHRNNFIVGRA
jgi:hypothetical protein